METEGTLEGFDVLAALVDLWRRKFTGALRFERESFIKIFYFHDGVVVAATSNDPPDQVGEILKKSSKITDEQLRTVEESGGARSIADRLITAGFITRKELLWALKMQLIEMIGSILRWPDGSWSLVENYLPKRTENVSFLTQHVLLELILRSGDRNLILGRIISPDDVLVKSVERAEDYRALDLSKDADAIVSRLDGTTSTAEIAASSKIDDFSVFKLLGALKLLGVLGPVGSELPSEEGMPSLESALAAPEPSFDAGAPVAFEMEPAGVDFGAPVDLSPPELPSVPMPAPEPEPIAAPSFELDVAPSAPAMSFEPMPELPEPPMPEPGFAPSFEPEMPEPAFEAAPPAPPVQMSIPEPEPEMEAPLAGGFAPEPDAPVRRAWEPPPITTAVIPTMATTDLDPLNEPTLSSGRTLGGITPEADEDSPSLDSSLGETFEEPDERRHSTQRLPGTKANIGFLPKAPTQAARTRRMMIFGGVALALALFAGGGWFVVRKFFSSSADTPPVVVPRPKPKPIPPAVVTTARELPTPAPAETTASAAAATSSPTAPKTAIAASTGKPSPLPTATVALTPPKSAAPPPKPVATVAAVPVKTAAPPPVKATPPAPAPVPAPVKPVPAPAMADYRAMARQFADKARSYPKDGWTIQVELVCADESVERALQFQTGTFKIWFIPISYRGKSCYRVFTGVYKTEAEARNAAANLPSHFTEGGNKPTALPLTKALK